MLVAAQQRTRMQGSIGHSKHNSIQLKFLLNISSELLKMHENKTNVVKYSIASVPLIKAACVPKKKATQCTLYVM